MLLKDLPDFVLFTFTQHSHPKLIYRKVGDSIQCTTLDTKYDNHYTDWEVDIVLNQKFNVEQAFGLLRKGIKVRGIDWPLGEYIVYKNKKFYTEENTTVNIDEIVSLDDQDWEVYEEVKTVDVKLNEHHTAVVSKDEIKVGCQTFSVDVIKKLAQALEEVQ
jgi:hypothetical protein